MNILAKGKIGFALGLAALVLVAFPAWADELETWVLQAFESILDEEIQTDAKILTGNTPLSSGTIASRHVRHPDHAPAIDYLIDRIEGLGFEPKIEPFDCSGPACANLIAEIPGRQEPEVLWILGAHFDSTNGENDAEPAPGAVDNVSGVAIVLQVLAALRDFDFAQTIRFVLFDAEETGLVGSAHHARGAASRNEAIAVMLNVDVAGWRFGEVNLVFANSDAPSWPFLERMNHIPDRYPCGTGMLGVPVAAIDTADMASFWDVGYAGLMVGSLYGLTGWMNTAQDTLDKLDLEQCANVARILTAYLAEEAGMLGVAETDDDDDAGDDEDDENDDTGLNEQGKTDNPEDTHDEGCGC